MRCNRNGNHPALTKAVAAAVGKPRNREKSSSTVRNSKTLFCLLIFIFFSLKRRNHIPLHNSLFNLFIWVNKRVICCWLVSGPQLHHGKKNINNTAPLYGGLECIKFTVDWNQKSCPFRSISIYMCAQWGSTKLMQQQRAQYEYVKKHLTPVNSEKIKGGGE